MTNKELQALSITLVELKAELAQAERVVSAKKAEVDQVTEKISRSNKYFKHPEAFINCGRLGLYHLKFHKETGALVAIHSVQTAVLDSPK